MSALHDTRCLNHRGREAVARCPSCRDFFCRECVTEHAGRVVCAKCLAAVTGPASAAGSRIPFVRPALAILSLLFVWAFFLLLGRTLLLLPDSFHDGSVWSADTPIEYIEDEP